MDKPVHFRRCHVCGTTNCATDGQVDKCCNCSKSLAPFYYFDDRLVAVGSDSNLRPPLLNGEYSPIYGLTAYWDTL